MNRDFQDQAFQVKGFVCIESITTIFTIAGPAGPVGLPGERGFPGMDSFLPIEKFLCEYCPF